MDKFHYNLSATDIFIILYAKTHQNHQTLISNPITDLDRL